jgi:hypothetical protein
MTCFFKDISWDIKENRLPFFTRQPKFDRRIL